MTFVTFINILKDTEFPEWIGLWMGRGWKAIFQVGSIENKPYKHILNGLMGL